VDFDIEPNDEIEVSEKIRNCIVASKLKRCKKFQPLDDDSDLEYDFEEEEQGA